MCFIFVVLASFFVLSISDQYTWLLSTPCFVCTLSIQAHVSSQQVYCYGILSCVDIRIDWRVFNYKPDDDKLIDLISYIGQPFPKLSTNYDSEAVFDNETRPLIRAIIQPHEGVWSTGYPFTIEPQQMVHTHYIMKYMYMYTVCICNSETCTNCTYRIVDSRYICIKYLTIKNFGYTTTCNNSTVYSLITLYVSCILIFGHAVSIRKFKACEIYPL